MEQMEKNNTGGGSLSLYNGIVGEDNRGPHRKSNLEREGEGKKRGNTNPTLPVSLFFFNRSLPSPFLHLSPVLGSMHSICGCYERTSNYMSFSCRKRNLHSSNHFTRTKDLQFPAPAKSRKVVKNKASYRILIL